VQSNTVLIFEGVAALLMPSLIERCPVRIYLEAPVQQRQARFVQYQQWRGIGLAEAQAEMLRREHEETPQIQASSSRATERVDAALMGDRI
jgi:cytidylate kinase